MNKPAAYEAMDLAAKLRRPSIDSIRDGVKTHLQKDAGYLADVFAESTFFPAKHASKVKQTPPRRKPDLSHFECFKIYFFQFYLFVYVCFDCVKIFPESTASTLSAAPHP